MELKRTYWGSYREIENNLPLEENRSQQRPLHKDLSRDILEVDTGFERMRLRKG